MPEKSGREFDWQRILLWAVSVLMVPFFVSLLALFSDVAVLKDQNRRTELMMKEALDHYDKMTDRMARVEGQLSRALEPCPRGISVAEADE